MERRGRSRLAPRQTQRQSGLSHVAYPDRRAGMPIRTHKGIGGVIAGSLLLLAGGFLIVFPKDVAFFHPSEEWGFVERVSRQGSQVYGLIAVLLGAGVIWLARFPRWGARNSAIEDYVWSLSQELFRHFGTKKYYSLEQVSRVATESGCRMTYVAYAHAMFCSRSDFDSYYGPLRVASTYDGFRSVIARRYFDGAYGFDAASAVRLATPPREEEYDFHQGAEG